MFAIDIRREVATSSGWECGACYGRTLLGNDLIAFDTRLFGRGVRFQDLQSTLVVHFFDHFLSIYHRHPCATALLSVQHHSLAEKLSRICGVVGFSSTKHLKYKLSYNSKQYIEGFFPSHCLSLDPKHKGHTRPSPMTSFLQASARNRRHPRSLQSLMG